MKRHRTAAEIDVALRVNTAVVLVVLCLGAWSCPLVADPPPTPSIGNPAAEISTADPLLDTTPPADWNNPLIPISRDSGWYSVPRLRPGDPGYWHSRHASDVKFRLRGRLDVDHVAANQSAGNQAEFGDLGEVTGLRRARIGAEGNLTESSRYVGEIDLATGQLALKDLYYAVGKINSGGEFRFGHMREPFSLEGGTSANSFAFLERSSINTLDPARNWGVDYAVCGEHENWTFSGGLFQAGTDPSDVQFGKGSTTALTTRWTALAWNEDHDRNLMHLGISVSERVSDDGYIVINQQPQSPLLQVGDSSDSPFVPKIVIPAQFQELINLQWAYLNGPLWSQAEWYGTIICQTNGPPIFYHGGHADVGYFITGGERGYLPTTGMFGPVTVHHPVITHFSSKAHAEQLGYGAWEATLRMAYLDFVDSATPLGSNGQPTGVMLPQVTAGLNWYLADRMRIMINYTYSYPDESSSGTTTASVIDTRLAVFW